MPQGNRSRALRPDLTDTAIKAAKPRPKPYRLPDRDGLALLVTPAGTKSWQVRYPSPATGKPDTLSLGTYPEITLAAARQATLDARKLIAQRVDPKAHRKAEKAAAIQATADTRTFGEVFRAWSAVRAPQLAPSSRHRDESIARNHILPILDQRPIRAITRPEIAQVLKKVDDRKLSIAGKVREYIDGAFEYAANHGYVEINPTPRSIRNMFTRREEGSYFWVKDPVEQGDMLAAMAGYTGQAATVTALNLMPYLMLRPGELRALEWREVELDHPDGPRLAIGRHRMKARKGKAAIRGPHIVPLTPALASEIEAMRPLSGNRKYVFPSTTPTMCLSQATLNQALSRLGYHGKQHPHGFRHMASTWLNQHRDKPGHNWHADAVERQLDHGDKDSTRDTYNGADYLDKRTEMLRASAAHLDTLKAEGLLRLKTKTL